MAVKNDPPIVLISTVPSMLILVNGDPVYREVKGTSLTRVLNTRPLLLKDAAGKHYLKIFDGWMEAPALTGTWTVAAKVPGRLREGTQDGISEKVADMLVGGDPNDPKTAPSLKKQAPRIYVETRPAELIVFEGDPKLRPDRGHDVDVRREHDRRSVRECRRPAGVSAHLGPVVPWAVGAEGTLGIRAGRQAAEGLRRDSGRERQGERQSLHSRHRAGRRRPLIANSVPQTAQVKRSEAKFAPMYDGEPKLAPIEATKMQYVVNTSAPVIVLGSPAEYFGVENGVWFVSNSLNGPWLVATRVPADIYSIPASSPIHYVTYVKIYDSTPETVVVGYTPGYTGAYVSGGCVVYGTGYYYTPWIGTVWYGPPYTYGFGVNLAYTPWAGWHVGFGFGWSLGRRDSRRRLGLGRLSLVGRIRVGRLLPVGVRARRRRQCGDRAADTEHGDRGTGVGPPATCTTDGAPRRP